MKNIETKNKIQQTRKLGLIDLGFSSFILMDEKYAEDRLERFQCIFHFSFFIA